MIKKLLHGYAEFIVNQRWWMIALCIFLVIISLSGIGKIYFNNDYRYQFPTQDRLITDLNDFERTYGKVDNLIFAIRHRDGELFSNERLEMIHRHTEQLWQMPGVSRVESLSNYQYSRAIEDDLIVEDMVTADRTMSVSELVELKAIALSDPAIVNRLVSADGSMALIYATVQIERGDQALQEKIVAFARAQVEQIRAEDAGYQVGLTGLLMLMNAYGESAQQDLSIILPAMVVALFAVVLLLLRSLMATIGIFLVVFLAALVTAGIQGWAGIPMTSSGAIAPIVILTIGIADAIHIYTGVAANFGQMSRREAIINSIIVNARPVFVTTFTTIVGFLSLNFVDLQGIRDLGNIAVIGVTMAWFYSVVFFPAFLAVVPLRERPLNIRSMSLLSWAVSQVINYRKQVVWLLPALLIISLALIPQIQFSDNFVKGFGERNTFRQDSDFTMNYAPAVYAIDFSFESGVDGGISDPAYLAKLNRFGDWLQEQPEVVSVNHFGLVMKRLNKNMHGDDPAWYKQPETHELAAQYLLLYEMSLPYGMDISNQVNLTKSATRVTAALGDIDTVDIKLLEQRANHWLQQNTPGLNNAGAVGSLIVVTHQTERGMNGLLNGSSLALILITLSLIIALWSVKFGLISILPNVLPLLGVFGLWALIKGDVGMYCFPVVAASLGLVVDFTVHFLSKYLYARRELGKSPEQSVHYSFHIVGLALWVSTLVLITGFLSLTFSDFTVSVYFGLLTAVTIVFAGIANLILLPPMLLLVDRPFGFSKKGSESVTLIPDKSQ